MFPAVEIVLKAMIARKLYDAAIKNVSLFDHTIMAIALTAWSRHDHMMVKEWSPHDHNLDGHRNGSAIPPQAC
jgi:hypothetical protein